MKKTFKVIKIVTLAVALVIPVLSYGQSGNGVRFNNANALRDYLAKQDANSPLEPIKIAIKVNDAMISSVARVIKESGIYVSLDLTGNFLTSIPVEAFSGCDELTKIIIPDSVNSIGSNAFTYCYMLTSVTFQGSISSRWFNKFAFGDSGFTDNRAIGDLRDIFYASNSTNGTPGTYTRYLGGLTWTKQP